MPTDPAPLSISDAGITYGPTGIRCGCGRDAHSNLNPCQEETTVTAELVSLEHQVDLRLNGAPAMTIGPKTVTPVTVRIAYERDEEDDTVSMVRIEGRGPSGFVDYYPLNDPAQWPNWLTALVEQHRPVGPAADPHCQSCDGHSCPDAD